MPHHHGVTGRRVLIFGASGMLGHKVAQVLAVSQEVIAAVRDLQRDAGLESVAPGALQVAGIEITDWNSVEQIVDELNPHVIINCAGIVKQRQEAADPVRMIEVNAAFPRRLAALSHQRGCRLIHFSTDCVFSGTRGNYREDDPSDAQDTYGQSKRLGEPDLENCLVLRSSFIGHELKHRSGLLEWFVSMRGETVNGFRHAIFSGLTTLAMARLIGRILERHSDLTGTWHVASEPICKFDLLACINRVYGLHIDLKSNRDLHIDRSLDSSRLTQAIGWRAPSWPDMIQDMHVDFTANIDLYRSGP